MGRPRLRLGTAGNIRAYKISSGYRAECLFRDMDGRTRPVKRTGRTKAQAIDNLKDVLRDREHRAGGDLTREHTFAEAGELWLAEVKRKRPGSTYDRYRTRLRNKIVPQVGELKLHECSVGTMDRYVERLERSGLAPATVRTYRTVLSGVIGFAVRMDAIPINTVRAIAPIEGKGKESRGLTRAEREDFLSKLDADQRAVEDDLPDLLRYLLGTGVRIAEAMALRWFRVDLEEGVVVHGDNLSRVTGKGLVLVEPKTEAGFRVLPLPDFVKMMLRMRYPGERYAACPVFPKFPMFPVLTDTDRRSSRSQRRTGEERTTGLYHPGAHTGGRWMVDAWRDPNNTARSIRKFRDQAGYPWFTAHTCRHTSITIMDQQGISPREISGYSGHARPSFTQDRYMDRRQQSGAAAKAIDSGMRPVR